MDSRNSLIGKRVALMGESGMGFGRGRVSGGGWGQAGLDPDSRTAWIEASLFAQAARQLQALSERDRST